MKKLMVLYFSLAMTPAFAQDQELLNQAVEEMTAGDLTAAAQEAVKTLASAAKDRILIRDIFSAEIKGPQGQTVGTVENLAVIPGGQIVAALVETAQGRTIAVPFKAVKVARAAGKLALSLPVGLSELEGMEALQSLTGELGD
ncbi:MAG: PRC-barrel domain-containing protein [Candidatus Competibacteraceae bacterium]|nr:PRC-barrel domain-containing protein [Candidatus Competibacteraceae bacterium]